ncbi:glutaredoxin-3 [Copidosoma floridanum]|uniref:glutaredoxin-3 n=1 Tax=Copidosoma floridanum TaxID=29053 RepID=UPI0006C9D715|nr:glutaredoxin-3 [Copidosoma floridanum]
MSVVQVNSNKDFQDIIRSDLAIVHFSAPWARQCTQINNVLEQMIKSADFKNVKFANVVAEDFPEISIEWDIRAVPTTLFFKHTEIVARIDGVNPTKVLELINKQLLRDQNGSFKSENSEEKIKKLVNQAPCVLFIKGTKISPRCGFSKSMIALVEEHKIKYEIFNVLEDDEVRESLKKFSDWPTFPQFYVNGKFIGGLDIVKELSKTGELDRMIQTTYQNLEHRLKELINQAPCMLFMKGNRNTPRCGFSKTIVSLLDEYNIDYHTFDILEDNEVREGLKKFSDWPTYPQLYINGEFIGGLDIVKEMSKTGALHNIMSRKQM